MKKLLVLSSLLAITGTALAVNQEKNVDTAPKMYLSVLDTSSQVPRSVDNRVYSVSNKNLQLCWFVRDMQFAPSNQVVEVFIAPNDKGQFMKADATISKNSNIHTIRSSKKATNDEVISNCWRFDNTDPLGKYTLDLQVNDFVFKGVQFELVK